MIFFHFSFLFSVYYLSIDFPNLPLFCTSHQLHVPFPPLFLIVPVFQNETRPHGFARFAFPSQFWKCRRARCPAPQCSRCWRSTRSGGCPGLACRARRRGRSPSSGVPPPPPPRPLSRPMRFSATCGTASWGSTSLFLLYKIHYYIILLLLYYFWRSSPGLDTKEGVTASGGGVPPPHLTGGGGSNPPHLPVYQTLPVLCWSPPAIAAPGAGCTG